MKWLSINDPSSVRNASICHSVDNGLCSELFVSTCSAGEVPHLCFPVVSNAIKAGLRPCAAI